MQRDSGRESGGKSDMKGAQSEQKPMGAEKNQRAQECQPQRSLYEGIHRVFLIDCSTQKAAHEIIAMEPIPVTTSSDERK